MVKATQIQDFQDIPEHLNFLGGLVCLSKKCIKERDARKDVRAAQKQQKIDARTQSKLIKAQAQADLAKQGIDGSFGGNFARALPSLVSGVGSIFGGKVGGLLGGGQDGSTGKKQINEEPVQNPKDNTILYIGLGIGFVTIVGLIVWAVKK